MTAIDNAAKEAAKLIASQNTEPLVAQPPQPLAGPPVIVIRPPSGWQLVNLRELWRCRELLFFLTWRDVKVRYKQTLLGAAWAILQPAMMMVVFTVFFARLAKVPAGDLPYPVFVYAGLLPWTFFATAISNAANSVVGSEQLISKVYFPRLIVPFAAVGAAIVDFIVAFLLLVALMLYYGIAPSLGLLWVPPIVLLATLAALGVGTLLAALTVAYRDFRYVVPFMVQLWMFATPTVYMNVNAEAGRPVDAASSRALPAAAERSAVSARPSAVSEKNRPSPAGRGAVGEVGQRPAVGQEKAPSHRATARQESSDVGDRAGVPPFVKALLRLNPMTALIASFRCAVLGGSIDWASLGVSAGTIVAVFAVGCLYFRRVEDRFADII